jgi:hypothetical protein
MDEPKSNHSAIACLGLILVISTFISGWAPDGPWGSESFTRGLFGLVGGVLLYLAWYRHKFGLWGVIPALSMWSNPQVSTRILAALGVALFFCSYLLGTIESLPAPVSLISLLCSLLILLTSTYAWFVFEGPLSDEEE